MTTQPQVVRSKPEDYWLSPSFVRRYVGNAVVTTNDNLGNKMFFGACMAALAQGIQYICPQPTSILYAGCGHSIKGSVIQKHFSGDAPLSCRVTGIDFSALMIEEGRKLQSTMPEEHRTAFHQMNVEALDFPDDSFDVAMCYGLLMSLPDPTKGIAEMMRVSRRGIVSIEECESVMGDEQRKYWLDVKERRYPGRIYWHDYIRLFREAMQLVITPMPIPPTWDMGQPPAYIRVIAVKPQIQEAV